MVKLRSMVINADKSGVDSTGSNDRRITRVGHFIRRYKLDEVTQLWNVLKGDMSLVGPRPNVKRETDLYTKQERRLVEVRPGITDFASIVFSDEGDILKDQTDPDIAYNQLIRPGKSLLGLFYIEHGTLWIDLQLIFLTAVVIASRRRALAGVIGDRLITAHRRKRRSRGACLPVDAVGPAPASRRRSHCDVAGRQSLRLTSYWRNEPIGRHFLNNSLSEVRENPVS